MVGSADKSTLISDPTVVIVFVVWLLPPVVVPPLVSLVAPVVAVSTIAPAAVGVPLTGQLMLAPAAMGGLGEQAPTVTPGGRPLTEQVAAVQNVRNRLQLNGGRGFITFGFHRIQDRLTEPEISKLQRKLQAGRRKRTGTTMDLERETESKQAKGVTHRQLDCPSDTSADIHFASSAMWRD